MALLYILISLFFLRIIPYSDIQIQVFCNIENKFLPWILKKWWIYPNILIQTKLATNLSKFKKNYPNLTKFNSIQAKLTPYFLEFYKICLNLTKFIYFFFKQIDLLMAYHWKFWFNWKFCLWLKFSLHKT